MSALPTQCSKKINGCFCDNVYVKNTLYTNRIEPKTPGGSVIIGDLDTDCIDCNNLNVFVGRDTGGSSIATAAFNSLVGARAGEDITTGGFNSNLGYQTGQNLTTGAGNVFIGHRAGERFTTGSSNVIIGTQAGTFPVDSTVSGNVLIGSSVGDSIAVSNRLMIDNTNTITPLLDGDFSADTLQVNGTVTLGQNSNTTNEHRINGRLESDGNNIVDYLVVWINDTERRIPIYDITP